MNSRLIALSFTSVLTAILMQPAQLEAKTIKCKSTTYAMGSKKIPKCKPPKSNAVRDDKGGGGGSGGGGGGGGGQASDIRLKHDLVRVGTTVYGLPLYDFEYTFKPGTYEGVMAQDVLKVMPNAVTIGRGGFYRVNYDMLGIKMKRIK
jgi:hypothetical protein